MKPFLIIALLIAIITTGVVKAYESSKQPEAEETSLIEEDGEVNAKTLQHLLIGTKEVRPFLLATSSPAHERVAYTILSAFPDENIDAKDMNVYTLGSGFYLCTVQTNAVHLAGVFLYPKETKQRLAQRIHTKYELCQTLSALMVPSFSLGKRHSILSDIHIGDNLEDERVKTPIQETTAGNWRFLSYHAHMLMIQKK